MDEQCYSCGHFYPSHILRDGLCDECKYYDLFGEDYFIDEYNYMSFSIVNDENNSETEKDEE